MADFKSIWQGIRQAQDQASGAQTSATTMRDRLVQAQINAGVISGTSSGTTIPITYGQHGPAIFEPLQSGYKMVRDGIDVEANIPLSAFTGARVILLRVILTAVFGTHEIKIAINGMPLGSDPDELEKEALEIVLAEAEMLKARDIIEGNAVVRRGR